LRKGGGFPPPKRGKSQISKLKRGKSKLKKTKLKKKKPVLKKKTKKKTKKGEKKPLKKKKKKKIVKKKKKKPSEVKKPMSLTGTYYLKSRIFYTEGIRIQTDRIFNKIALTRRHSN
jgi:hypothetical protein